MSESKKSIFDTLKDSINQIVSGSEQGESGAGRQKQQDAAKKEIESAVIVLVTEVMRLSGNHSSESEKKLFDFLERNFSKVDAVKRKKLIHDHLFVGPQPFTRMACEQLKTLATHESKFEIIRLLYDVAALDDFINSKENEVIQKIAKYLGLSTEELRAISEKYKGINSPFEILEMKETLSVTEVKAAYRKMVLRYHPDKQTGKIDAEANKKFREIRKAYEQILKKLRS